MVVNRVRCHTCPFNDDGDITIRNSVSERCITLGSQLCHGTDNKTLCKGARDFQLKMLCAMGVLPEPTQQAWDNLARKLDL